MGWIFSLALFYVWLGNQDNLGMLIASGIFAIAGAIAFNCKGRS